ncbi:MAG: hypothetical protein LBF25_01065 [Puniceicoccales bacterium]|nr:hypothetical protein [Puniceicoccales bacterium]
MKAIYYLKDLTLKNLEDNFNYHFSTQELDSDFKSRFSSAKEANEAKIRFPKSVIMYKAFIGIALKKLTKITCNKGRNGIEDMTANVLSRDDMTIRVQRGATKVTSLNGPKQGIADSTALGRPLPGLMEVTSQNILCLSAIFTTCFSYLLHFVVTTKLGDIKKCMGVNMKLFVI